MTMMDMAITRRTLIQTALFTLLASASPAPTARVVRDAAPQEPQITPSPVENYASPTWKHRRNILSDVESDIGNILSGLGSDLPSWVASGVPNFFQGFPTGSNVVSSLGLNSAELAALPTNVLNIDPYANWTNSGWNVRFHGNVYKQPNTSVADLNKLANVFLVGTEISNLTDTEADQARNLTAEIFVVQQGNVAVNTIHLEPAASQGSSGQTGGGGATEATGGTQDITLPYNTTVEGDFDVFVPIKSNGLTDGNATSAVQRLNTYVGGATLGNGTAYLVPPTGLTVVSDIDDILRITKIYEPEQGLLNSFARAFTPWENMPSIYANWSTSLPNMHFHYLTTTPEQITRNYMQFIYSTYPGGSFDTRPLNFSDVSATLSIRKFLLEKIFQTFPERKFILIADTSNSDVMVRASERKIIPKDWVLTNVTERLPPHGHGVSRPSPVHLPPQHQRHRLGRQIPLRHIRLQEPEPEPVRALQQPLSHLPCPPRTKPPSSHNTDLVSTDTCSSSTPTI